jgi:hypothetical protein
MELICFEVEPGRVPIRQAPAKRQWMDETPGSSAYRCLPLTAANSHGWELLCPVDFRVRWRGGAAVAEVEVHSDAPPQQSRSGADYLAFLLGGGASAAPSGATAESFPAGFAESQFGSGILTFNPLLIIRPPPGHDLWVTGPVNRFKDAIQPMSALIEADWMPFTFSMNWQITRADTTIAFEKDEPFCSFFPVTRGLVGQCEPVLKPLGADPALQKSYWESRLRRNAAVAAGGQGAGSPFQGWYANRKFPGDATPGGATPPKPGKGQRR